MANDTSIQCSDTDLEPLIRNTFVVQVGNSTTETAESTDVGIVSFNNIVLCVCYSILVCKYNTGVQYLWHL